MERKLNRLFRLNDLQLAKINAQRRIWLYASSIVFTGIILLIFTWDWIDHFHSATLWWAIIALILIISVNWWYWTMRVVHKMLQHQKVEFNIIKELLSDIRAVRVEIAKLGNQSLDKSK